MVIYMNKLMGVAMGFPLGLVFANIFMYEIETILLKSDKYHNFCNSLYCWYRHVDNIFCVFSYELNMLVLLNVFNSSQFKIYT